MFSYFFNKQEPIVNNETKVSFNETKVSFNEPEYTIEQSEPISEEMIRDQPKPLTNIEEIKAELAMWRQRVSELEQEKKTNEHFYFFQYLLDLHDCFFDNFEKNIDEFIIKFDNFLETDKALDDEIIMID